MTLNEQLFYYVTFINKVKEIRKSENQGCGSRKASSHYVGAIYYMYLINLLILPGTFEQFVSGV